MTGLTEMLVTFMILSPDILRSRDPCFVSSIVVSGSGLLWTYKGVSVSPKVSQTPCTIHPTHYLKVGFDTTPVTSATGFSMHFSYSIAHTR